MFSLWICGPYDPLHFLVVTITTCSIDFSTFDFFLQSIFKASSEKDEGPNQEEVQVLRMEFT